MSNDSHAIDHKTSKGWWRSVVGYGKHFGIDLNSYQVVCPVPLGSPFGSLSPIQWKQGSFPQITTADMASLHNRLLDHLNIERVHAVVGGSMGGTTFNVSERKIRRFHSVYTKTGMQALQFASMFPERFVRCVAIASTGKTTPGTVALRSVQRSAIELDPEYVSGNYTEANKFPRKGLGLARKIGTINYRSRTEFDARFDSKFDENTNSFEVERYLEHQAEKFTYYDPNCYLLLSKAMDLHDVRGLHENCFPNRAPPKGREVCLLPYDTDVLMPPVESLSLSKDWSKAGVRLYTEVLKSKNGHDAFLIQSEAPILNTRLASFLSGGVDSVTEVYNQTVRDVDMGL